MKQLLQLSSNEIKKTNFNFSVFLKCLRILCLGWLVYQSFLWFSLNDRPKELFEPIHYLSKIFFPEFPSGLYFFFLITLCAAINIYLLLKEGNVFLKVVLFVLVAGINTFKWSYGFFSHVSHTFLLCHFFTIFVPDPKNIHSEDDQMWFTRIAQCTFAGILITYSFSGMWKILGLIYKFITHSDTINWLHKDAALINAIVNRRYWDDTLGIWEAIFEYPLFWQVSILVMIFFQLFSVIAAFRTKWRNIWCVGTILFHLHNTVIMHTEFHLATFVILILLFPYHLLRKPYEKLVLNNS